MNFRTGQVIILVIAVACGLLAAWWTQQHFQQKPGVVRSELPPPSPLVAQFDLEELLRQQLPMGTELQITENDDFTSKQFPTYLEEDGRSWYLRHFVARWQVIPGSLPFTLDQLQKGMETYLQQAGGHALGIRQGGREGRPMGAPARRGQADSANPHQLRILPYRLGAMRGIMTCSLVQEGQWQSLIVVVRETESTRLASDERK